MLIASSTDTHADHLRAAASAGIPALCEKPIDLSLARAVDVVGFAVQQGIPAMVDFNRRFDRDYAELQRVVASGEVGDVHLIQMTSRGPVLPPLEYIAVSGGQMRDQTVHFFDLARWISGLDPEAVFATGSTLVDPRLNDYRDVDTSAVTLRLPGGALVQIDSARQTGYGYDERIEVLGSTGMVEARRHRAGAVSRYGAGRSRRRRHASRLVRARGRELPGRARPLRRRAAQTAVPSVPNLDRGTQGPGDRRGGDHLTDQRSTASRSSTREVAATSQRM